MSQWSKIEAQVTMDTECFIPADAGKGKEGEGPAKLSHTQARVRHSLQGRG